MEAPRITVSLGYTRNMGNFESLRVDIGVSDSCRVDENPNDTFARVYKFTEGKLISKVRELEQELKNE